MTIWVSGSIAFDIILDYPDRFSDHMNPRKAHVLSLSFLVNKVKRSVGGTAGNIVYNLAMLGLDAEIIGWVGSDGRNLRNTYQSMGIGVRHLRVSQRLGTATGYIMTDQQDNQIAGFYPGAMLETSAFPKLESCDWPIIAAENPRNMARLARHYQST
ncbi:MAG: PfkB family carbohydrate kinase, partial [bacterium]|nr:PfkB family carbohydrate kinase [bacterium]